MTVRTDSANTTALQSGHVPILIFVEMEFGSGYVRCTNASYTIPWNGHDWLGLANFGSIDSIEEGVAIQSYGIGFKLSGVDPAKIEIALAEDYQNKIAKIWFATLNPDTFQILGNPTLVFSGLMDTMPIELGTTATITVTAESRFVDWDRPRVRYYTDSDQQGEYPGDLGLQYVNETVDKEIVWGRS